MDNDLTKELQSFFKGAQNPLIITLGNELRSDDAIGIIIGKELEQRVDPEGIINAHNVPVNFIGKVAKIQPDRILFIDAVDGDLDPGTIIMFGHDEESQTRSLTTHYQESEVLLSFLKEETGGLPRIQYLGIQISGLELLGELDDLVMIAKDRIVNSLAEVTELS